MSRKKKKEIVKRFHLAYFILSRKNSLSRALHTTLESAILFHGNSSKSKLHSSKFSVILIWK